MPLHKLRIETQDQATAVQIAESIGAAPAPEALAVTAFELAPPKWVVEAYYDAPPPLAAIEQAVSARAHGKVALEAVPEANWVALSQAALPPVRAGRVVVHGGHDRHRFALQRLAIEIEAGEAFGTAHNATTVLCLEALDTLVRRRHLARVLDLGCGTGVLAIAAARALPHARVLASDNDPVAVAVARDNVRRNRVASRVRVLQAAGFEHAALRGARQFDLVLANILPRPVVALAPAMRAAVAPGGVAVLSGLLDHQAREVAGTYLPAGFRLIERRQDAGWTALVLAQC
jgi:ribosomal protein L11 methyltransferase